TVIIHIIIMLRGSNRINIAKNNMIRDIGRVGTHPIYGGVSTPPIYRESFEENRWIGSPQTPLRGGGGRIEGTVGGSLIHIHHLGGGWWSRCLRRGALPAY